VSSDIYYYFSDAFRPFKGVVDPVTGRPLDRYGSLTHYFAKLEKFSIWIGHCMTALNFVKKYPPLFNACYSEEPAVEEGGDPVTVLGGTLTLYIEPLTLYKLPMNCRRREYT